MTQEHDEQAVDVESTEDAASQPDAEQTTDQDDEFGAIEASEPEDDALEADEPFDTVEVGDDVDEIIEQFDGLMEDEDTMNDARNLLLSALEKFPSDLALRASHAELEIEMERYERGIAIIDAALEDLDEADTEQLSSLLNLKAYAFYYLGGLDEARRTFNQSLRADSALWSGLVGRATVHDRMGFLVAALLDLEHAIEIDDQEAEPFALRAQIFMKRGQIDQAQRDYNYAVECDFHDEESRLNLARIQARAGATAVAIELLEPLLAHGENDDVVAVGALLRSQLSLTLGSTDVAQEDAEVAIARWPERPWGYLQLAACQLTSMHANEAIKTLKKAESFVDNIKDVPDITALRASAYEQLEKTDQARRERNKVEGSARLPAVVYGPILNPAQNIPINPDKPIDIRAILADLFGHPDRAPKGYEDALRNVVKQIPQIVEENPNVERIQIELPEVEGMRGQNRHLVIQVNQNQGEQPAQIEA